MGDVVIVDDVVKEFPIGAFLQKRLRILNGISFILPEDANLAIVGPNASGKTTLLKMLASIYLPDSGSVEIYGYDLKKQITQVRDMLSFVSPSLTFQAKLTLKETLDFFAGVQGTDVDNIALDFLEEVNLTHMMDKRLESFSEGQKAMVRLVVGLMKQPRLLLLDEVTATLDLTRKEAVINTINELDRRHKFTIILVDHDPMVVDRICDKVLLLKRGGRVLKYSTVHELLSNIPYKYDIKVTPKKDLDDAFLKSFGFPYKRMGNIIRFFTQNRTEVNELNAMLLEKEDYILEFSTSGVSLEDIYYFWMQKETSETV
ncbi:MAG: ATP-binding cassette domain-containing protein [Promethearchaeota archaeon]